MVESRDILANELPLCQYQIFVLPPAYRVDIISIGLSTAFSDRVLGTISKLLAILEHVFIVLCGLNMLLSDLPNSRNNMQNGKFWNDAFLP